MSNIRGVFVFILLVMTMVSPGVAQRTLKEVIGTKGEISYSNKVNGHSKKNKQQARIALQLKDKEDTVYSAEVIKRHGWMEPQIRLTKEQARHRYASMMFTRKNKRGHWTKMEVVGARGNYISGQMGAYVLNANNEIDSLINDTWKGPVSLSCVFDLIPDPTGNNVVQERAYDAEGTLLYTYSRVPIGDNKFIGSYKDSRGMPAEMRKEESKFSYGTLVLITQDANGYEQRIEFIDSEGRHKNNAFGAFAEMFERDQRGNLRLQYSVDSLGNRCNDNAGNCAVRYEYNLNGTIKSALYLDKDLQPFRMMQRRYGTYNVYYEYDNCLQGVKEMYVDPQGVLCPNDYGCAYIEYTYDDWGNIIEMCNKDKNGDLINNGESRWARTILEFDTLGRCVYQGFFDKDNSPAPTEEGWSQFVAQFSNDGECRLREKFHENQGCREVLYKETISEINQGKEYKTQYADGSYYTVKRDKSNRIISEAFFNKEDMLMMGQERWACKEISYTDNVKSTKVETKYYDDQGRLAELTPFNREILNIDSIQCTTHIQRYKSNQLVLTYIFQRDKRLGHSIVRSDCNVYGQICRSGGASAVRLHSAEVEWAMSHDGEITNSSSIVAKDEFGEPDYIVGDGDKALYYYKRHTKSGAQFMSAENVTAEMDNDDQRSLRNTLPKVMSIEVTDSVAYQHGLKDNDVILQFGDYFVDLDMIKTEGQFITDWTVRNVVDAELARDMVVFRVDDAQKGLYGLKRIPRLSGTPSELGFIPHVRYLTDKQKNRIQGCVDADKVFSAMIKDKIEQTPRMDSVVCVAFPEMFMSSRGLEYPRKIRDASVLIGACDVSRNLRWNTFKDKNFKNLDRMKAAYECSAYANADTTNQPKLYYIFAKRLQKLLPLKWRGPIGARAIGGYVSERDFNALKSMHASVADAIDKKISEKKTIDKQNLCGYWQVESDSTAYAPEGWLYLDKNGECYGSLIGYVKLLSEDTNVKIGNPIFKETRDIENRWSVGSDVLCLANQTVGKFECVDVENPLNSDMSRNREYFNEHYADRILEYRGKLISLGNLRNEMFIVSLDKNRMVLDDGCGNLIRLTKSKKAKHISFYKNTYEERSLKNKLYGTWRISVDLDDIYEAAKELTFKENGMLNFVFIIRQKKEVDSENNVGLVMNATAQGEWYLSGSSVSVYVDAKKVSVETSAEGIDLSDDGMQAKLKQAENLFKDVVLRGIIDTTKKENIKQDGDKLFFVGEEMIKVK